MYRRTFRAVGLMCVLACSNVWIHTLGAQNRLDSLQYLHEVVVTGKDCTRDVIPVQQLSGE